jgi:hypothetical protein
VILEIRVHRPDVVPGALHVLHGEHRGQHRVVLVVVLVHAVAADGVQVGDRVEERAHGVQPFPIRGIVDRIRLRHPQHRAVHDFPCPREAELLQFVRRQSDQRLVATLPQPVPLEAEVFEPETGPARLRDHRGAPIVEVLDSSDLHARRVHVDPVVWKQVLPVENEHDHEEVPIPQSVRRLTDIRRHRGTEAADERANRHRGDHVIRVEPALAGRIGRAQLEHPAIPHLHARDPVLQEHVVAQISHAIAARLPHLPRTQPRVLKGVDQASDGPRALVERRSRQDRLRERKALNALGRPLSPNLAAGHSPDLLRIRLEKGFVQPLAKAVGDPLLEGFLVGVGTPVPPQVAQKDQRGIPWTQAAKRVARLQRVVEEHAVVVDSGKARHGDELFPQDLAPQRLDRFELREEAMPADVESESLVLRSA